MEKTVVRTAKSTFGMDGLITGEIRKKKEACNETSYTIYLENHLTQVNGSFEPANKSLMTFRYGTSVTSDQVRPEPVLK